MNKSIHFFKKTNFVIIKIAFWCDVTMKGKKRKTMLTRNAKSFIIKEDCKQYGFQRKEALLNYEFEGIAVR